jgi:hypothetical protein
LIWALFVGLTLGFQNCSRGFQVTNKSLKVVSSDIDLSSKTSISANKDFANSCIGIIDGYKQIAPENPSLYANTQHFIGNCGSPPQSSLVFSVTHEDLNNGHSKDNPPPNPNIVANMSDYDYKTDFGKWVLTKVNPEEQSVLLKLDTNSYPMKMNSITGRPIQDGHLFAGLNDMSVNGNLGTSLVLEFDYRLNSAQLKPELYPQAFSGHRFMLGFIGRWNENFGRTNQYHFLEVDVFKTLGYGYNENLENCPGTTFGYDRCFYDPSGRNPEGRYVSYGEFLLIGSPFNPYQSGWQHVRIPITELFKKLKWVSSPTDWNQGRVEALYFGIESQGSTELTIELKNYQIFAEDSIANPKPKVSGSCKWKWIQTGGAQSDWGGTQCEKLPTNCNTEDDARADVTIYCQGSSVYSKTYSCSCN